MKDKEDNDVGDKCHFDLVKVGPWSMIYPLDEENLPDCLLSAKE